MPDYCCLFNQYSDGTYKFPVLIGNGSGTDVSCFPIHETYAKDLSHHKGVQLHGFGHAEERGQKGEMK